MCCPVTRFAVLGGGWTNSSLMFDTVSRRFGNIRYNSIIVIMDLD